MAAAFERPSTNLIMTVLIAVAVVLGYVWYTKQASAIPAVPAPPAPVEQPQEVVSTPPQPRMTGPSLASYTDNVGTSEIQPAPVQT